MYWEAICVAVEETGRIHISSDDTLMGTLAYRSPRQRRLHYRLPNDIEAILALGQRTPPECRFGFTSSATDTSRQE